MTQAQLAASPDRLPWLTDEVVGPRPKASAGRPRDLHLAGAAALAAVAAASFWLGAHSWQKPAGPAQPSQATTTVAVPPAKVPQPEVRIIERQPQIIQVVQPNVRQTPQPEVKIAKPATEAPSTATSVDAVAATTAAPAVRPVVPPATVRPAVRSGPLTAWPARVSNGAYGRLVQIGAFGTRLQAKRGWWAMVRAYPAVSHLQAVVVETRNSRGRPFYRFQIGTTSQAHSEVLCQRMEKIRMSCAVIGLPWKPQGVER